MSKRCYSLRSDGYDPVFSAQTKKKDSLNAYMPFTENVHTYFLSEALNYVLCRSLGEQVECADYAREICREFVKEEGYNDLMRKFASATYTLANIEKCVSEACDSVICKCDKDNNLTWTINNVEQSKFFDSLKDLPIEKVTTAINKRVCDAAEDFVQNNINMKLDIEQIATKTKERIDAAKAKYDDTMADTIQKEQMTLYKQAVDKIKSTSTRNVYEHMMNITSKAILENESMRESYLDESGQFDMSKVESRVKTMYTFLEMVNSLRIKKVNNKYIEDCISSIQ